MFKFWKKKKKNKERGVYRPLTISEIEAACTFIPVIPISPKQFFGLND
jgi:hypothetical protein